MQSSAAKAFIPLPNYPSRTRLDSTRLTWRPSDSHPPYAFPFTSAHHLSSAPVRYSDFDCDCDCDCNCALILATFLPSLSRGFPLASRWSRAAHPIPSSTSPTSPTITNITAVTDKLTYRARPRPSTRPLFSAPSNASLGLLYQPLTPSPPGILTDTDSTQPPCLAQPDPSTITITTSTVTQGFLTVPDHIASQHVQLP